MIVGDKGCIYSSHWNTGGLIRLQGEPRLKDVLHHDATKCFGFRNSNLVAAAGRVKSPPWRNLNMKKAEPTASPYRHNTFGNLLESPELKLTNGVLAGQGKSFDIRIHALTLQAVQAETWMDAIQQQAAQPVDVRQDWEQHRAWWSEFWNRSWIVASDNSLPAEARGQLRGEAQVGPAGRRRRWGAGCTKLQRVPVPDGLPESRPRPDEIQWGSVHPAVAGERQPQRTNATQQADEYG